MLQLDSLLINLWQDLPLGIFLISQGPPPRFITVNPAVIQIYGYDGEQDMLGVPLVDLFDDPVDMAYIFVTLQSEDRIRSVIRRQRRKDGSRFWASISASKISNRGGSTYYTFTVEDVTEQKQQESILEWGKKEWEAIFDTITELAFITDVGGRIIKCNKATTKRLGKSPQEIIGQTGLAAFFGEEVPQVDPFTVGSREVYISSLSSHFVVTNNPLRNVLTTQSMVHVMTDITERKRIEALANEREAYYRSLAESLPIGAYIAQDGCIQWANAWFSKNTGYSANEIAGHPCLSLVHPDDRRSVQKNAVAMLREKAMAPYGYRFLAKNGEILWCIETVVSITYQGRRAVLGSQMDISGQKRAEDALRASEERYRTILETIPDAYYEVDLTGNNLMFNEAYLALFERPREEMEGVNYKRYTEATKAGEITQIFNSVYQSGIPIRSVEWEILTKGGAKKPVEISVSLIRNDTNEPTGFRGILRDITERKRIEDALRLSEERYRTIVETIPNAYFEVDLAGNNIFCNERYLEDTGYTMEEVRGMNFRAYMDDKNAALAHKIYQEVYRTGKPAFNVQLEWIDKSGRRRISDSAISLIRDPNGKATGFRGISRDITEKRHQEILALHSQKLESVGQLAAGIAHEINTPIQFVGDNIHFLDEAFRDILALTSLLDALREAESLNGQDIHSIISKIRESEEAIDMEYLREEIPKAIQQSLDGLQRVGKIVQAMREFSHPGGENKTDMDINRAIESTITLTRNEWKYTADLTTDLDPGLPVVKGYLADFNQVLLNLIVNASQALQGKANKKDAEKGKIEISTRQDGNEVEVCIRDSGQGIPPEAQSRIFDPFFTTKEVGKGTGQGLTIAQNIIVRKHGGKIYFETIIGEGTAFFIRLPLDKD